MWNDTARLLLVRTIGENAFVLKNTRLKNRKSETWWNIYQQMVAYGMPKMSMQKMQSTWGRILAKFNETMRKNGERSIVDMSVQKLVEKYPETNKMAVHTNTSTTRRVVTVDRRTGNATVVEQIVGVDDNLAIVNGAHQPPIQIANTSSVVSSAVAVIGGNGVGARDRPIRSVRATSYRRSARLDCGTCCTEKPKKARVNGGNDSGCQRVHHRCVQNDEEHMRKKLQLLDLKIRYAKMRLELLSASVARPQE